MATLIAGGLLGTGGAIFTSSAGDEVAVFINSSGDVVIYSDVGGTPSLEDSDTATTVHSAGAIDYVHAAMDSSDNIHIICSSDTNTGTRDVSYALATESAGSWTLGSWEAVLAGYTQAVPLTPGCAISIDSNDKPHVIYVDHVKQGGATI
jgi:hypothetical protein